MLLIIDNVSNFIKKFKRDYLVDAPFPYLFFDHNEPIVIPPKKKVKGIILSGGRGNPFEPLNLTANFVALMNFNVPVLGFCLGHEIIASAYMGRISKLPSYQNKKECVTITQPMDPIFIGLNKTEVFLRKQHHYHVSKLPESFASIGCSKVCPNEIIKHKKLPIYGFQSHPEVSGVDGLLILENFFKICKLV